MIWTSLKKKKIRAIENTWYDWLVIVFLSL